MIRSFLSLLIVLSASISWATDYYASASGSGSTCSIGSPCSLATGFVKPVAGDTLYLRGGTYNISTQLATASAGTSNTNRITVKNYPGESPHIVSTYGSAGIVDVRHDWWTFDGIAISGGVWGTETAIISTYNIGWTSGLTIKNCTLTMTGANQDSNNNCIYLNGTTDTLIQNNTIVGQVGYEGMGRGGIIMFQGQGTKILNNIIHGGENAIFQKHPNWDTSLSSGAEWAYNYIYGVGYGFLGRPKYVNIHNNIVNAGMFLGVDGGDPSGQGSNDGNMVNHNTITGQAYWAETSMYGTFKNNIVGSWLRYYVEMMTWSYNVIIGSVAVGPTDQGNTSVTFVGGATPSTIAGYMLTSASNGHADADDGKDVGADVTLVGNTVFQTGDTTAPTDCTITGPTSASTYNTVSNSATVSGTAADAVGISHVTWRNSAGGYGTATGTTTWSVSVPLTSGTNVVLITAYDAAGNSKSDTITIVYTPPLPTANECTNYTTNHPEWIFCDDFEGVGDLVTSGRYWDYSAPDEGGSFSVADGVGRNGTRGIQALFVPSNLQHGGLMVNFGRNPAGTNGINITTDYNDIYWRFFMRTQSGWSGWPHKLTRAIVMSADDWASAAMAHLWVNDSNYLALDPSSCVTGSTVDCTEWNDLPNYQWLGAVNGILPIFDGAHNNTWYEIETHLKLNDSGSSNGIFEYWIDGVLQARQTGLNFVGNYTTYGINVIAFPENYGCTNCVSNQYRYFDNFVVSTAPIGTATEPTNATGKAKFVVQSDGLSEKQTSDGITIAE